VAERPRELTARAGTAAHRGEGAHEGEPAMTARTELEIHQTYHGDAVLLAPDGVLALGTYGHLRDSLLKAAMEIPKAVIVDVDGLRVPTDATLAVFSSVWMQVSEWPGVPIVLVASRELDRRRLERSAITRFIPVHAGVAEALAMISPPPPSRRSLLELPYDPASASLARRFVQVTCGRWDCADLVLDAELVANELVENAVRHAHSEARIRLELRPETLTVAVYDDNPQPVQLAEPDLAEAVHLGLLLVARLSTTWNCAPTLAGGKVVWAVLNRHRPAPDGGDREAKRRKRNAAIGT
jgi:anti-sigma regulatory factor (Ser/Thr protein kinase)